MDGMLILTLANPEENNHLDPQELATRNSSPPMTMLAIVFFMLTFTSRLKIF